VDAAATDTMAFGAPALAFPTNNLDALTEGIHFGQSVSELCYDTGTLQQYYNIQ
jgi:hypothetical protein